MDNRNDILKELTEAGAFALLNAGKSNCFSVPVNYFDNLPGDILTYVFLKSLPFVNPYAVPEGYFENLPDIILEKIDPGTNIHLTGIDKENPYSIPDDYFENLANNILKKIKTSTINPVQKELEEISPLLSKIPKTNVYSVPQNYFTEFDPLADTTKVKPAAKIISLGNTRKLIKYAVAATVAAVLFGGGYHYLFNKDTRDNSISSLDKMALQKEISVLSDDEIADYLKNNTNMAVYTNTGTEEDIDIQGLLQTISDEEIQQYLNDDAGADETGEGEGI